MVPYADFNLLRFPDKSQALEKILDLPCLTDILPTGYHGCVSAGVTTGSTVLGSGTGPVGLAAAASRWQIGPAEGRWRRPRRAAAGNPGRSMKALVRRTEDLRIGLSENSLSRTSAYNPDSPLPHEASACAMRQARPGRHIMRYRTLGDTGLLVSEICLGTMTFGGRGYWSAIGGLDQSLADRIVGRALDAGVNFIDTADVYSEGLAEEITGRAMHNCGRPRSDLVLATKVFSPTGKGVNDRGASRGHILDGIKASLRRLGTDYIDLYQIHGLDQVTPIEETLRALEDLVRQGHVRYVGVSNWSAWALMKALGIAERHGWMRPATLQACYSIAGRDIEREIVPLLQAERLGLMVWSPLAGGLLSGKFTRDGAGPAGARRAAFDFPPVNRDRLFDCVDVMRRLADARGVSVARLALAYVLAKPFVTSVIIGAKTLEQLDDNLAAAELRLTADELTELDAVSALPSEYPGWMIEFQHSRVRLPQDRS